MWTRFKVLFSTHFEKESKCGKTGQYCIPARTYRLLNCSMYVQIGLKGQS